MKRFIKFLNFSNIAIAVYTFVTSDASLRLLLRPIPESFILCVCVCVLYIIILFFTRINEKHEVISRPRRKFTPEFDV